MKQFKEAGAKTLGYVNLDLYLREYLIKNWRELIKQWFEDEAERELLFGDVELSPLDQTIDKDTVVKVDDEEIHVLYTPGHWKACLCVYLPSSKVLFAGDTIF